MRPAVNLNLSVSRVGSAAQKKTMKSISGALKLFLASYKEMVGFSSYSSDLGIIAINTLNKGSKITELLKQKIFIQWISKISLLFYLRDCLGY